MKEAVIWGFVVGFFAIWVGFSVYSSRRGWSKTIGIGGGFLVACLGFSVVGIVIVAATDEIPSKQASTPPPATQAQVPQEAIETPKPRALPNRYYVIQDGTEYGYEQAVSSDALRQGQVAAKILMFRFLGERNGVLQFLSRDGDIHLVLQCDRPCEFVKQMVFFDQTLQRKDHIRAVEGSIAWAVTRDAMNGFLTSHTRVRDGKAQEVWFDEKGPKWRPVASK